MRGLKDPFVALQKRTSWCLTPLGIRLKFPPLLSREPITLDDIKQICKKVVERMKTEFPDDFVKLTQKIVEKNVLEYCGTAAPKMVK